MTAASSWYQDVESSSSWVSVAGTARVVDDTAKLTELWNTFVDAWLQGGGERYEGDNEVVEL